MLPRSVHAMGGLIGFCLAKKDIRIQTDGIQAMNCLQTVLQVSGDRAMSGSRGGPVAVSAVPGSNFQLLIGAFLLAALTLKTCLLPLGEPEPP